MEIETELMRRAIRFHSPAIGLNFFDYSTGQRRRSISSSSSLSQSSLSSSMMTLQNPYLRSLGYDTTTTTDPLPRLGPTTRTSAGGGLQNESLVEGYSVIGVKHGGWPSSLANQGMEGGYHWNVRGRNDYVGDGGSRGGSEMDRDDEEMLCLLQAIDSTRVASGHFEVVVDGENTTTTGMEKEKEKRGAKMDEVNIQSPKVHRHRLLQPQQCQRLRGGQSAQFTRYCCLHHDQYQQQQQRLYHANETTNTISRVDKEGTVKTGNKDWWIEYRPIPIEAPVCQSCLQHVQDRDQAGHSHHGRVGGGGGGGVRIEFGQLRVSLDWILSGFVKV
ncbi:MAG: hypothetical protein J3R72DRAFT_437700 [Linnemannia gamsii]|nr:MAG: hypothetical protein J3R72DRAFT_437700 [Linnemannia gamsii]